MSLTIGTDSSRGTLTFETNISDRTRLSLGENSSLIFEDNAFIVVNILFDYDPSQNYTFTLIDWKDSSNVAGLEDLINSNRLWVRSDGNWLDGIWKAVIENNSLTIVIPEPATCAVVLGALAIAFAFMRRRR